MHGLGSVHARTHMRGTPAHVSTPARPLPGRPPSPCPALLQLQSLPDVDGAACGVRRTVEKRERTEKRTRARGRRRRGRVRCQIRAVLCPCPCPCWYSATITNEPAQGKNTRRGKLITNPPPMWIGDTTWFTVPHVKITNPRERRRTTDPASRRGPAGARGKYLRIALHCIALHRCVPASVRVRPRTCVGVVVCRCSLSACHGILFVFFSTAPHGTAVGDSRTLSSRLSLVAEFFFFLAAHVTTTS